MAKTPPKFNRADLPGHFFAKWIPETRPVRTKPCDHPGCSSVGEYRAPLRHYRDDVNAAPLNVIDEKTRDASRWFCLDHVKQYNATWDYYEGLDQTEMEQAIRFDGVWNRPTWRFGQWGPRQGKRNAERGPRPQEKRDEEIAEPAAAAMLEAGRAALAELGLSPPVEFSEIRKSYHALVKQHHPDMQGEEAGDSDTIKRLNAAFSLLKTLHQKKKV
jgi:hypothetical protein